MNSIILKGSQVIAILIFTGGFLLTASPSKAQALGDSLRQDTQLQPPAAGTRLWTGTASLRREVHYFPGIDGTEKDVQTLLDIEFRWLRHTSRNFGWGVQGFGELFMSGTFGNVALGTLGVGPVLRGYPWQSNRWQTYLQANFLAGYDMALADAIGANRSEGMRYRPGLQAGISRRLSNTLGLYLEAGPVWEADETFQFDSRGIQLDLGIQLFRF